MSQSKTNKNTLSMGRLRRAGWMLCAALLLTAPCAHAASVHWKSAQVAYSVEGKDLKDVLRDFAASQGIPAKIGDDVSGSVSGRFNMSPQRFLDTLGATFGFVWYYDGTVLDIVMPSEMTSTLLKLDSGSTAQLRTTLENMGVADARFPLVYDDAQGAAIVNGPPDYVKMVSNLATRVDANAARLSGSQVTVFPLHHAWAADHNTNVDGQSVTISGVATLLNSIYHPSSSNSQSNGQGGGSGSGSGSGSGGSGSNGQSGISKNKPMADLGGGSSGGGSGGSLMPPLPQGEGGGFMAGLSGKPSPSVKQATNNSSSSSNSGSPQDPSDQSVLPVIQADPRTNSVVIRDLPDRMYQYPDLLARLDVKPRLIEIEAHFIEINDNALQQLGVDWTASNGHINIQTGNGTSAQNTYNGTLSQNFGNTTLAGGVTAAATPPGVSLAAVVGDAGRYLMTRISALQQDNLAKVDASPKVTTLDNLEAVMDYKTQFFVPVSGYTSADLYSISTGVSLRVLPMVVEENGTTQIKLDVSIEDGEMTGQTVSNIPVIASTNINTSAFIAQGQALLIAGYRVDNRTNTSSGVPFLSKIPGLGALFRDTSKQDSHMENLFLLTPRIIEP